MSDLLESAAAALGTPSGLIQRSAAARAAANGTSTDDVLTAWAGGAPVAAPPTPEPTTQTATEPEPVAQESAVAVLDEPVVTPLAQTPEPSPQIYEPQTYEPEPEVPLEPAPLGTRVRTAVRVGAWTGAGLGLIGFLTAGAFWASTASTLPDGGPPFVQVRPTSVMIGVAVVSVLFGAVVAGLSRAAAAWRDPAMQLSGSRSVTGWIGAGLGLLLGIAAASLLTDAFGTPIEGSEEGLVQLPVLATLAVMLVGGAILGAMTAAVPQIFGVPVATAEESEDVAVVRKRLGDAIGIPLAGLVLLAVLVLPFAYALLQSDHLANNSAAVIAIVTAGGILGFASLAGSKPHIKISFGELMVAVIGIGTVLLIILAVLVFRANEHEEAEPETRAPVVRLV